MMFIRFGFQRSEIFYKIKFRVLISWFMALKLTSFQTKLTFLRTDLNIRLDPFPLVQRISKCPQPERIFDYCTSMTSKFCLDHPLNRRLFPTNV